MATATARRAPRDRELRRSATASEHERHRFCFVVCRIQPPRGLAAAHVPAQALDESALQGRGIRRSRAVLRSDRAARCASRASDVFS
jgi:hypothetical protein